MNQYFLESKKAFNFESGFLLLFFGRVLVANKTLSRATRTKIRRDIFPMTG